MRIILTATTILAISLLAYPEQAFAQENGCPWCVTPTACDEVEEDTPIEGCYNIGNGCEEISGSCENLRVLMSEATRAKFLLAQGVDYRGQRTVAIHGLQFNVFAVGEGLYARWACDGRLAALFREESGTGEWTTLDTELFGGRFDIDLSSQR